MNKIFIGNLRKGGKRFNVLSIKCDRGTPLGNPFNISLGRAECIKAYADNWTYLIQKPNALAYFNMLKAEHAKHDIALMCWCAPKACHCDIIKTKLEA